MTIEPKSAERPYAGLIGKLKEAGLRPTRQRLALARLLFEDGGRHVTAETLHNEILDTNVRVSLATVYNTLHQFTASGLMREVIVEAGRSYFDTTTTPHHHFFDEESQQLIDIPNAAVGLTNLPEPPADRTISRIDVVVRLSARN